MLAPGTMGDKLYIIDSGECQLVEKVRDDSAKKKVDRAVQERIVSRAVYLCPSRPLCCVSADCFVLVAIGCSERWNRTSQECVLVRPPCCMPIHGRQTFECGCPSVYPHLAMSICDCRWFGQTNGVTRLWVLDRASYQSIGYKFSDIRWLKRRAAADQFGLLSALLFDFLSSSCGRCTFPPSARPEDMVEDERVRLSNMLELVQFNDKDVIFRQFDPAEDCFLIDQVCQHVLPTDHSWFIPFPSQGRVNLVEQLLPSSPYTEIARLDAGMVFGEVNISFVLTWLALTPLE